MAKETCTGSGTSQRGSERKEGERWEDIGVTGKVRSQLQGIRVFKIQYNGISQMKKN